jgi:hypothetical protein
MTRYNFARFFSKVQPVPLTGCWIWRGGTTSPPHKRGYPILYYDGRMHVGAHVVSYTEFVGPIPAGYEVDHLCFNPLCVNPAHLEAVTPKVNVQRRWDALPYCRNGHFRTPENTVIVKKGSTGRVSRMCRECRMETWRRNRLAARNARTA